MTLTLRVLIKYIKVNRGWLSLTHKTSYKIILLLFTLGKFVKIINVTDYFDNLLGQIYEYISVVCAV